MRIMLICVGILFGCIFAYKVFVHFMIKHAIANTSTVTAVATMKAGYSNWKSKLSASGSLRAVRGVNVTCELAGMVQTIYFTPGADVKEGDVLVQLNADNDIALLHSLQANAELASITYNRDKAQYAINAISKQVLDNDAANLKNLNAQVAQQAALVAKKTIRAPFSGRLGINNVNPGQYVNPGDKIVSLQTLDPIYADFYMPQQALVNVKIGNTVTITSDSFPGKKFTGKITTIDPAIDTNTRNVEIEATLRNLSQELTPGMFVYVDVDLGKSNRFITVPQTAIFFNPYGDIAYIVTEKGKDKNDKPILIANQTFVKTGEIRGDQITVLQGINEGDIIVTSGQLKLKNGSQVSINNTVMPANDPVTKLSNEHIKG